MYTNLLYKGKDFDKGFLFQIDIEDNIPEILSVSKDEQINIIVVGAWHGDEIKSFLHYNNVRIFAFEPNPANFNYLKTRYSSTKNVTCYNVACGEHEGKLPLYEGTITGNDSLLPIKDSPRMQTKAVHEAQVIRLDSLKELEEITIHLLWADVQGYELSVLKGAEKILHNVQSLFLEVNEDARTYEGTTIYSDLNTYLLQNNFKLAHKEIDSRDNTGNALYLSKTINTNFFTEKDPYSKRILTSLARRSSLTVERGNLQKFISAILPFTVRAHLKKLLNI